MNHRSYFIIANYNVLIQIKVSIVYQIKKEKNLKLHPFSLPPLINATFSDYFFFFSLLPFGTLANQ